MPLIVLCGLPSSGKSTRAVELRDALEKSTSLPVLIISDNDQFQTDNKDVVYKGTSTSTVDCFLSKFLNHFPTLSETSKEKNLRAAIKSDVQRALTKDVMVIVDAQNYIKGYRYEIYCITKTAHTTQCTVIHFDFCGGIDLHIFFCF